MDLGGLTEALRGDVAAVVVQSPNFFGAIEEELADLGEAVHAAGALLVVAVAEALSLGRLKPPSEADIVGDGRGRVLDWRRVMEEPFVGVIASRDKFVRQIPGRLAGRDNWYRGTAPGFVLTLGDAGTAYSAGEGDFEYLYESGTVRAGGHGAPDAAW